MRISLTNTNITTKRYCILFALSIIVFMLNSLSVKAQDIISLTSKQGLQNSQVRDLYQDSRRSVWIGTQDGLFRYDGAKLRGYYCDKHDPTSLGFNYVISILEYDRDRVLIGTKRCLYEYNYRTDSFRLIPFLGASNDTLPLHVSSLFKVDSKKIIAFVGGYGSYEITENADGVLVSNMVTEYITSNVTCVLMVKNKKGDQFLVNDIHEVYRRKSGAKQFVKVGQIHDAVTACVGDDNNVYVGTLHRGLFKYDEKLNDFVRVTSELESFVTSNVVNVNNGFLGICTDGQGLKLYNVATGHLSQSRVRTPAFDFTQSNVKDVLYDDNSNLWIGVFWKGVFVMPFNRSAFSYVGRNASFFNAIGTNCVTTVAPKSKDEIWVATDNCGLYKVNMSSRTSVHVDGLPSTVSAICQNEDGTLYIGSSIGDFMKYNPSTGAIANLSKTIPGGERISGAYSIDMDSNGNLWVATMGGGLSVYRPQQGTLETFTSVNNPTVPQRYRVLVNTYIKSLKISGNNLCVGTADGLEIFTIGPECVLKGVARCGVGLQVNALRADCAGNIWAATTDGLLRYSFTGKDSCRMFTVDDGLPSGFVTSLEIPNGGRMIWLSTHRGICCFDSDKGKAVHNYLGADGLQDEEFADNASMSYDGKLYFGGINGLTFFNPEDVVSSTGSTFSADVQIVDFFVFGKSVSGGQKSGSYTIMEGCVSDVDRIDLCSTDNTFSFDLSVMNVSCHGVRYDYSVNGGEWISLSADQHTVAFTNMEPGTYRVKVRAIHGSVVLSEKEVTICVHPAWYLSPLAKFIYLLFAVFIAYLIYMQVKERIRARKILEHHKQNEQLNEARIQFFMNISHEIRTPMTLILSPLEKLMNIDKDEVHQRNYKLINQNAQRILRLINQLMDVRKIEKGEFAIEYTKVEVVSFLQGIYDVFEVSARTRNITYDFVPQMDKMDVFVDAQSLDKIVMNLLSNAFKFTADGGKVSLVLKSPDEHSFTIEVIDDGVGIPDAEKEKVFRRFYSSPHQNGYIGTGIGLNLTSLLVGLHGGNIEVLDNPEGKGTDMFVTMPIGDESQVVKPAEASETTEDVVETKEERVLEVTPLASNISKKSGRRFNIVVVDDEIDIRQYIHSEFASEYNVAECGNGREAWDYVLKNPESVDLVISDISMPLMDGNELCKRIKANYNTCHIPVILLTAKASDADRIAGAVIGADAYVTKPFNLELLMATTSNLLMSRAALKGRYGADVVKETTIEKIDMVSPDQQFLEKVNKLISKHIDDPDLSVESIADSIGFSRVHFYRKIKELTGQTPLNYVKTIRLQQAARLLLEHKMDVTGVSVATGFRTLSTFSTSFKELYGMTPSDYVKEHK